MLAIRSALFNASFWFISCALAVLGLPLLPFPPGIRLLYRFWGWLTLGLLRSFCGIRGEIRGKQFVLPSPAIYAVKHQSAWDIFILLRALDAPLFVLKRELTWIPLFGLYLTRLRMISIDRSKGPRMLRRLIPAVKQGLKEGHPVVIFPEGTRKPPRAPAEYLPGIAALYTQLHVPVVPVALNSGLLWGRNAFVKRPGVAVIEFLPAIAPGLNRHEFMQTLQQALESATTRLLAESQL